MPNVIKMTEQEALNKLAALKIEVEDPIVREPKEGFEKGVVFEQSKPEGTRVKEGSSVRLYVSEGRRIFRWMTIPASLRNLSFSS